MALQASLQHHPSARPNQPPFPLILKSTAPERGIGIPACALGTAASGGDDDFPHCPICGGFHSESFDCRPPWLAEHLDSRDPGIPNC